MTAALDQSFQSTTSRWQAVSHRDPAAHSSFVYGVRTTKIYCRPTCTARIARRANIAYFGTREAAESEGFRPCLKCRPDDDTFLGQREEVVFRTINAIYLHKSDRDKRNNLRELAQSVEVTPSYLCRVFKNVMGSTLSEYIRQFEDAHSHCVSSSAAPSTSAVVPENVLVSEQSVSSSVDRMTNCAASDPSSRSLSISSGRASEESVNEEVDFDSWLCMDDSMFTDP
ncbi:Putative Ada DNA repair, metal-binding, Homeobox-like domain superfamily [Septoria linicola]|uniref:Ada DNA repair, metal-binding, Homeobox-like domain superfamily n=1 Tax=Septoria linicola TaxID=215465 RepID=A0A9Q9EFN9_9PEZI|nr:putative Ada DNA repair, metal-binding, Homeobox-like domain superfamily [Septoria linicola]USW49966.1 Putative Ada DNA repair, metal-binding, Homeobox-like domain superfamily [Septoria linicola]